MKFFSWPHLSLTLSKKHWKNHLRVYKLVSRPFLSMCFFSLGRNFFITLSWCSWKRINLGNPGMKNPERERREYDIKQVKTKHILFWHTTFYEGREPMNEVASKKTSIISGISMHFIRVSRPKNEWWSLGILVKALHHFVSSEPKKRQKHTIKISDEQDL